VKSIKLNIRFSRRYDMNNLLTAVALAIALPAVAHAQSTPAPAAEKDCCEEMKEHSETSHAGRHDVSDAGEKCCCKDMAGKDHAGHDMEQHDHAPQTDGHEGHQQQ
jgi:hypothetical protein